MTDHPDLSGQAAANSDMQRTIMSVFLQMAALVIIVAWCFQILSPFIGIVVWALIIAVALYPIHGVISNKLGGRPKSSAVLLVLILLGILLTPAVYLAESTIGGIEHLSTQFKSGEVEVPPPNESVKEWPLIGEKVHAVWVSAADNLEATLNRFSPQLLKIGNWLVGFAGSMALGTLQFIVSILIAGAFLLSAGSGYRASQAIASNLSPEHGGNMVDMAIGTIRSVAKGVLGVAIIQAVLAAIGLVLIGVPAAGLWSFLILVLAIVQLPPWLILGPIAIWVFSVNDGTSATIFAIYALIVSISDAFLKPMLLGRGLDIPMLVILLGAIGGAITAGIVGLFTGAVVLAVGYQLLVAWMNLESQDQQATADDDATGTPEQAAEQG